MKREYNYDLLRIVSTVAVIMIHVSATWFHSAIKDIAENGLSISDIQSPFWICIFNSLSRFAVPSFLMLSGAFILDNNKNMEYKKFYSKTFAKIGIPTVIFSVLYILYRIPFCFLGNDNDISLLKGIVKDVVSGSPMYHMWYLYMLIGVYILAPIVLRFKNSISEKSFYIIAFIFLILANISHWSMGTTKLSWDVGQSFEYLGYFMAGYSIRKISRRKNNIKALLMIILGLLIELCVAKLEYQQIIAGIAEKELEYSIGSPYSPLIVPASLLIFYGFTILDIKMKFTKLSGLTFYIYLIHAGVWNFICRLYSSIKNNISITELDGSVWILVYVILVFSISYWLSKFYIFIWNKLDKEKRITNYFVKLVKLQVSEGS